jgi:hypothetical protein
MGLVWLMFGRTRRKAEKFTSSVITVRTKRGASKPCWKSFRSEFRTAARAHDDLAAPDDLAMRRPQSGGITKEFDSSSEKLMRHGEALDRAAESARNDMAVLLDDLPRAEQTARAVAEQIRNVGSESAEKAASLGQQVSDLAERTEGADQLIAEATARLGTRLPRSMPQARRLQRASGSGDGLFGNARRVGLRRPGADRPNRRAGGGRRTLVSQASSGSARQAPRPPVPATNLHANSRSKD